MGVVVVGEGTPRQRIVRLGRDEVRLRIPPPDAESAHRGFPRKFPRHARSSRVDRGARRRPQAPPRHGSIAWIEWPPGRGGSPPRRSPRPSTARPGTCSSTENRVGRRQPPRGIGFASEGSASRNEGETRIGVAKLVELARPLAAAVRKGSTTVTLVSKPRPAGRRRAAPPAPDLNRDGLPAQPRQGIAFYPSRSAEGPSWSEARSGELAEVVDAVSAQSRTVPVAERLGPRSAR